ncbi:hypothetical protein KY285_030081 [Solanum tuberosum]|nr:hypothetical protein KY285_030081 [Solanum tuberosum]
MAPKAKNVEAGAGSKRNQKGEKVVKRYGHGWFECQKEANYLGDEFVNEGDCNLTLVREFYANWNTETRFNKTVPIRGKDVKFTSKVLNLFLGTPNCDAEDYNSLKENPPYRDSRHTLCGEESTARWDRSNDTWRNSTLHYAYFNQVARVWLKIVCSVFLSAKHLSDVTRDRVVLVYMLMKGGDSVLGLITRFLRAGGMEEEELDMNVARTPYLICNMIDVTRTKALDTSHGPVLSAQERHARDDSVMSRMFGMVELQLRIGGRPVMDNEMETLAERYPLTESATYICRIGPAFQKPLDDEEANVDEEMDDEEEEDDVDEDANTLMVFDGGRDDDDEA